MNIAVIGTGYVGLTTAVAFAHLGHDVTGIDIDHGRVEALNRGRCPIVEEGLPQVLAAGLDQSRLSFTTEAEACAAASIIFLCLPTPASPSGHPDLSAIEVACANISRVAAEGAIVVCKSTVAVGTNKKIQQWLGRSDLRVASNPEFLREGTALSDFLQPDRVVIGTTDAQAAEVLRLLYRDISDDINIVGLTEAELIKYAANAFLATKLSYVNEIARICAATDADSAAVLSGVGSDHRISAQFLNPGPGWGGSCFPKDTLALHHLALDLGLDAPVIGAAIESNDVHTAYVADAIDRLVDRKASPIAVWGLTFKAGTDDTRDSPAVAIVEKLLAMGHRVTAFDPEAQTTPAGAIRASTTHHATTGADLLVVLTEWADFAKADLRRVARHMRRPQAFDTRAVLDPAAAREAGLALLKTPMDTALASC